MEMHRWRLKAETGVLPHHPSLGDKTLQTHLGFNFLIGKMRRLDQIMVKVPSSSTFLGFGAIEVYKSTNMHSLPNPSCHLLLCTSAYFSIFFSHYVGDFPGACLKTPRMRSPRGTSAQKLWQWITE